MSTTIDYLVGNVGYDWQTLLFQVLKDGAWQEADGVGLAQVTLVSGTIEFTLTGTFTLASGVLTSGTVTSLQLQQGGQVVATAAFTHSVDAVDIQSLVGVATLQVMLAGLVAVFGTESVTANGSSDHDDLFGGLVNDTLDGNDGNDRLVGSSGDDQLNGGAGWDDVRYGRETGSQGVIVNLSGVAHLGVAAGTARDTFGDTDTLTGIDFVGGTSHADVFFGKVSGPHFLDFFMGGAGADVFTGGTGNDGVAYDIAEIEGGGSAVIVNLSSASQAGIAAGHARDTYGNIDTLSSIEWIAGSALNDTLIGSGGSDTMFGRAGADMMIGGIGADALTGDEGGDTLIGGAGTDTLNGNSGNDMLDAGTGVGDHLAGGTGNDTYFVRSASQKVDELGASGNDTLKVSVTRSLVVSGVLSGIVENLTLLGTGSIDGTGNGSANIITGNTGMNRLAGLGGADRLIGGVGKDVLVGGGGNDLFVYAAVSHSRAAAPDVIRDFDDAGNDRIDLSALFGPAMTFRGAGAFTGVGQVRIVNIAGPDVLVQVNTGGSLAADFAIRLSNTTLGSMTAGDFIL